MLSRVGVGRITRRRSLLVGMSMMGEDRVVVVIMVVVIIEGVLLR